MVNRFFKIGFTLMCSSFLGFSALLGAAEEGKGAKAEEVKKEAVQKVEKKKKAKIETRQLIYMTATRKIIPVGQFLLKDGIVSAITHPSPVSRLFFTAKASPGYYLVAPNGKSVVKASIKATPIKAEAEDGAKVSLLVSDAEAMMFVIEGNGFKPNEKVKLISKSYDESIEQEAITTSDGQLFAVLAPAVVGKGGGICKTEIVRESDAMQIKFPWGREAISKERS